MAVFISGFDESAVVIFEALFDKVVVFSQEGNVVVDAAHGASFALVETKTNKSSGRYPPTGTPILQCLTVALVMCR